VTLRARLVLALMALALLPTIIFTLFTLDQLGRATDRWFRPGVDRALDSGVEATKSALTRLETTVLAMSDECALRLGGPRSGITPVAAAERRPIAARLLRGSGIDVIQFYHREPGGWRLMEQVMPEGVLLPEVFDFSREIEPALLSTRVIRSNAGALGAVASLGPDDALAAAIWVPPTFFADMDSVGEALGYYRQLGVVVDVQRRYVWLLVALLSAALIGLAWVIAQRLAREMARPLADLSDAIEEVAAGDLGVRVVPSGAREMRVLGEGFNAMAGSLATAREQLKAAEREATWREVARRLAHEFKNIMNPMSLSLYRLRRRTEAMAPEHREAYAESLQAIDDGVRQITRLSDQFSKYARMPEPHFERLDLTEVTRAAGRMHEHERVRVEIEPGPALPIRGDSLLLSRAIHNLLLNACEASPDGAVVRVRTRAESGRALIEVFDEGSGVPAELMATIFDPYVSTKNRGSGLGLSLVRDVAGQHDGAAGIENRSGGGARAWFTLPLYGAQDDAPGMKEQAP
jgi:nitrogen fixation/metabolism regulation signal transduction histidine kinase